MARRFGMDKDGMVKVEQDPYMMAQNEKIKYVDPADHPKAFDGDKINLWDFDEPVRNITVGEVVLQQLKELSEEYFTLLKHEDPKENFLSVKYRKTTEFPRAEFELNRFIKWIEKRLSRDYNTN